MTTTVSETDLRYPIGKFDFDAPIAESDYPRLIALIAETPGALRSAVAGLTRDQLETRYRPGGWTVKQLVHHVPDSHLNAYTRFKLALTEDEPTIKPYDEAAWAELPDSRRVPIEVSLDLLDALHMRWVALLRSMEPADFNRAVRHPEHGRTITLKQFLGLYAWHGRHHVAHITALKKREAW
ncbi:MAG TPA: putative metal-dependent hydrolase [Gemmatimonadaceae bacterium]|nr:putative metal-dependent hydrolase [Gemmatimonadaceae bacterium]